jgi:hypothetical protein
MSMRVAEIVIDGSAGTSAIRVRSMSMRLAEIVIDGSALCGYECDTSAIDEHASR